MSALTARAEAVYSRTMLDAQPIAKAPPRVVATVSHYRELLQTIRERLAALDITHETLDAVAGLQSGYASKLLSNPPIKRMGPFTQFIVLQALGIKLQAVEDPEALAQVQSRLVRRQVARRPMHSGRVHPIKFELGPDFMRKIQSKGGRNSRKNLPARKRTQLARKAARARWQNR